MAYLTKKQLQEQFIEEFLRRLREAPEGERVYMRVGDLFKPADVHSLDELRAARETALVRNDEQEDTSR
jgi:chaperonin cofactor prefoldin